MLILSDTRRRLGRKMLLIRASVYPKDKAESFDSVLETKLVDGV